MPVMQRLFATRYAMAKCVPDFGGGIHVAE